MQLRDAGRLDLDDPAVAWLPELRRAANPFAPIETVTIRRMLSHESGLPAEPPATDWARTIRHQLICIVGGSRHRDVEAARSRHAGSDLTIRTSARSPASNSW